MDNANGVHDVLPDEAHDIIYAPVLALCDTTIGMLVVGYDI